MDQRNRDDRSTKASADKGAVPNRRSSVVTVVLLFVAAGLVLDGIAGQRGWLENRRGQQQLEQSQMALEALQRHNAEMRDLAKRLQDQDPATVEDLARRELGFIRPGEKLFIVRDSAKSK